MRTRSFLYLVRIVDDHTLLDERVVVVHWAIEGRKGFLGVTPTRSRERRICKQSGQTQSHLHCQRKERLWAESWRKNDEEELIGKMGAKHTYPELTTPQSGRKLLSLPLEKGFGIVPLSI